MYTYLDTHKTRSWSQGGRGARQGRWLLRYGEYRDHTSPRWLGAGTVSFKEFFHWWKKNKARGRPSVAQAPTLHSAQALTGAAKSLCFVEIPGIPRCVFAIGVIRLVLEPSPCSAGASLPAAGGHRLAGGLIS